MIKTKASVTASKPKGKARPAAAKSKPEAEAAKKPAGGKATSRKPKPAAKAAPEPAPEPKAAEPKKGGNPPVLTDKDVNRVIEMLRQCGGIKTVAAEKLNVSRSTLYLFLKDHPEIQEAAADIKEELLDVAEGRVVIAIRSGEMQTVRWYLELMGKERGYVRRVETTGKNGGPVETREKPDLSGYSDAEIAQMLAIEEAREEREKAKAPR